MRSCCIDKEKVVGAMRNICRCLHTIRCTLLARLAAIGDFLILPLVMKITHSLKVVLILSSLTFYPNLPSPTETGI